MNDIQWVSFKFIYVFRISTRLANNYGYWVLSKRAISAVTFKFFKVKTRFKFDITRNLIIWLTIRVLINLSKKLLNNKAFQMLSHHTRGKYYIWILFCTISPNCIQQTWKRSCSKAISIVTFVFLKTCGDGCTYDEKEICDSILHDDIWT